MSVFVCREKGVSVCLCVQAEEVQCLSLCAGRRGSVFVFVCRHAADWRRPVRLADVRRLILFKGDDSTRRNSCWDIGLKTNGQYDLNDNWRL